MRAAAVELTTALFMQLLDLPETSEVVDIWVDSWTKNLVVIVKDDQFPEKVEGAQFVRRAVVMERTPNGPKFVKYV